MQMNKASMPLPPPSTPKGFAKASMPPPRTPSPGQGGGGESNYDGFDDEYDEEPVLEIVEVEEQPDVFGGDGNDFAFIILIRLSGELREVDRFVRDFQDFDQYLKATYPEVCNFELPRVPTIPEYEEIDDTVDALQDYLDTLCQLQFLVLDLADFLDIGPSELNKALFERGGGGGGGGGAGQQQRSTVGGMRSTFGGMRATRGQSRMVSQGVGGMRSTVGSRMRTRSRMPSQAGGGGGLTLSQMAYRQTTRQGFQTGAVGGGGGGAAPAASLGGGVGYGGGFGSSDGGAGVSLADNPLMTELERRVQERLERMRKKRGVQRMTFEPSMRGGPRATAMGGNGFQSRRSATPSRLFTRQLREPIQSTTGGGARQSVFLRTQPRTTGAGGGNGKSTRQQQPQSSMVSRRTNPAKSTARRTQQKTRGTSRMNRVPSL
jgi:hypothetical protein